MKSRICPLLTVSLAALAGCTEVSELNLEVESLVSSDSVLYEQTSAYLPAHQLYDHVNATLDCPDSTPGACLLRIEADNQAYEGPASSIIVYVATGVQPLPGPVDLAGAYQYGIDPVTYAAVQEVSPQLDARRYNYLCQYHSGTLSLDQAPVIDQWLSGQFDLDVDCVEQLSPDEVLPARLKGVFGAVVEAPPY